MPEYKIRKLNAKRLLKLETISENSDGIKREIKLNLDNDAIFDSVVEAQLVMGESALFYQLCQVIGEKSEGISDLLLNEIVILDFTDVYKKSGKLPVESLKSLFENGFILQSNGKEFSMMPFDKSGNMSRKCRITFVNSARLEAINERLNLGIDFEGIPVTLNKYYSYRGLYLSNAKRIEHKELKITSESFVVIKDIQTAYEHYAQNVTLMSADLDSSSESEGVVKFSEPKFKRSVKIETPYDGQGLISPEYSALINEVMQPDKRINSFQIRMPFTKGMLHTVDFRSFFNEFNGEDYKIDTDEPYLARDVFGIKRDLKKAQIIIPESMFKCCDWLDIYSKKHNIEDPIKFYCDQVNKYNHSLYISSTDIPYGNSGVTHLTYQMLNTLALTEAQFKAIIQTHLDYIENPIKYLEMINGQMVIEDELSAKANYELPNWQRAVMQNSAFSKLPYIRGQLTNIQNSLKTKLLSGKIVVSGETRYLARDLLYMLVTLIQNKAVKKKYENFKIYNYKFFLPQGEKNTDKLEYYGHCAFFRSPHLSRNEQSALMPVVENKSFNSENYDLMINTIQKYFSHLKGVVMIGFESIDSIALGGADFDGDLVVIIREENVVNAVLQGCYSNEGNKRSLPFVQIPSSKAKNEFVPETVPFSLINDTFSDRVGIISDFAIEVGQSEYGDKKSERNDVTCAQCTIYTGLEIDAAKSGRRPKLPLDKKLETSGYLSFKKEFEELKKTPGYYFNELKVTKNGDEYSLALKGNDEHSIKYKREKGTYINDLPVLFMDSLENEMNIPYNKKVGYFNFNDESADVKAFSDKCNEIFVAYSYYKELKKSLNDANRINSTIDYLLELRKLLWKQYDEEKVASILKYDVPYIKAIVTKKINSHKKFVVFKKQINELSWHLLNQEQKISALEELFDLSREEIQDNEHWSFLLNPYYQGYKALWFIVVDTCQNLTVDCFDLISNFKLRKQIDKNEITDELDLLFTSKVTNKEDVSENQIYECCKKRLDALLSDYNLSEVTKMKILFDLTKSKNSTARFFWESFSWDSLEMYIVKEDNDA